MGDFKDESAHNLGPLTMQIRRSAVGTGDNYDYMRKISAVGLFCFDQFEETPKQKVIDLSKF